MLEQRWLQAEKTNYFPLINSILEVNQSHLLPPNLSLLKTYLKLTNCVPLTAFQMQVFVLPIGKC